MYVEGEKVMKNSEIHNATVTGDTIGDPFKDTSGPSLNILMKLMTMISLVFAKKQFYQLQPYDTNSVWIAAIIAVCFTILAVSLTLWMRWMGFGKTPKKSCEETEQTPTKREDAELGEREPLTDTTILDPVVN